jgi:hypothetical protein
MFKRNETKGYDPLTAEVPGTDAEAVKKEKEKFFLNGDPKQKGVLEEELTEKILFKGPGFIVKTKIR